MPFAVMLSHYVSLAVISNGINPGVQPPLNILQQAKASYRITTHYSLWPTLPVAYHSDTE